MYEVEGSIPARGTFLQLAGHFAGAYIWMLGALYALYHAISHVKSYLNSINATKLTRNHVCGTPLKTILVLARF